MQQRNLNIFSKLNKRKGIEGPVAQITVYALVAVTAIFVLLPLYVTVVSSLKTNYEFSQPMWSLPKSPVWSHYSHGMQGMFRNLVNTLIISLVSTAGVLFVSTLIAYVFVRHKFPGKEIIFAGIIALMVVPGVLTLTPTYLLYLNLGLRNTWWSLIIPYIVGGQVGAIFLFRAFLSQQPADLFEAAKIDGANEWHMYTKIALPLAVPIIILQGLGSFGACYNDFMWPLLMIDNKDMQTLMPVLRALQQSIVGTYKEAGIEYALYLMSGIPLIFTTFLGLKFFINGEFASGMKL